jgi:hypothetical protein
MHNHLTRRVWSDRVVGVSRVSSGNVGGGGRTWWLIYETITQKACNRNVSVHVNLATCKSRRIFGSCHEYRPERFRQV